MKKSSLVEKLVSVLVMLKIGFTVASLADGSKLDSQTCNTDIPRGYNGGPGEGFPNACVEATHGHLGDYLNAETEYPYLAQFLIANGAIVNNRAEALWACLHAACSKGDVYIAEKIVQDQKLNLIARSDGIQSLLKVAATEEVKQILINQLFSSALSKPLLFAQLHFPSQMEILDRALYKSMLDVGQPDYIVTKRLASVFKLLSYSVFKELKQEHDQINKGYLKSLFAQAKLFLEDETITQYNSCSDVRSRYWYGKIFEGADRKRWIDMLNSAQMFLNGPDRITMSKEKQNFWAYGYTGRYAWTLKEASRTNRNVIVLLSMCATPRVSNESVEELKDEMNIDGELNGYDTNILPIPYATTYPGQICLDKEQDDDQFPVMKRHNCSPASPPRYKALEKRKRDEFEAPEDEHNVDKHQFDFGLRHKIKRMKLDQ